MGSVIFVFGGCPIVRIALYYNSENQDKNDNSSQLKSLKIIILLHINEKSNQDKSDNSTTIKKFKNSNIIEY